MYAIEQVENSIILSDLQLNKDCKYAVVLGNEVKGVQQSVVDKCDQSIEIPQFGTKHFFKCIGNCRISYMGFL